MSYRTVNLRPETFERLQMYKVGRVSMSDVIEKLMDEVEPEDVFARALRVHRKRVQAVRRRGGLTLAELEARMDRRRK
jgi:predicted CopG family antitoxin